MRIYGHRGAMGEAPESTLPGFRHAIALGLDAVEFDVQLTADGHLVVIHDATVDRTTDGTGPVAGFTLAALQALDARAAFPTWPEPCHVPTLAEVLDVVDGLPALLVEFKRDRPGRLDVAVPATVALVRERGLAAQVTFSSFDPYALEVAEEVAPEIPRLVNGAWRDASIRERALGAGCTGADFEYRQAGAEHIEWARQHGLTVVGWPCNTPDDLAILGGYGVDAVGSDFPSAILDHQA